MYIAPKVCDAGYTGEDPVSCFGIFIRQSDRKLRVCVTDAMARLGKSLSNENPGDRVGLLVSFEVIGKDWHACDGGARKITELLEAALPECDADGWLVMTCAEAEGYIQRAATALGIGLGEPHRERWTWLEG